MPDISKKEEFIKYKKKSAVIKNGWYVVYCILFPLFFGLLFSKWLFLAMLLCIFPIVLMCKELGKLNKELRELRATANTADDRQNQEGNEKI